MQLRVGNEDKLPSFAPKMRVVLVDDRGRGQYMEVEKVNRYRIILVPMKEPPVKWSEAKVMETKKT
jgi:hypothetical protein